MVAASTPTRSERETFEIARKKASPDEAARLDEIYSLMVELGNRELASIREFRESKARRGEKVRPLTRSEREFVDDLGADDGGLDPAIRGYLERQASARAVLHSVAHGQCFGVSLRRSMQRHYSHPEEKAIEQRLIDLQKRIVEALFAFIGDSKVTRRIEREVANMRLASGSGSALYVLLDVENEEDAKTNGKEIGRAFEHLEEYARKLSVRPLSAFFGFGERGSGDWFEPADGLRSVEALITHVSKATTKVKAKRALIADLDEAACVLRYASERKARFHIEIDT